jgi:hypothetical protein
MTTLIPKINFKNGGSTPTGAVNRTINQKSQDYVSVKDFGAIGDNVADDTVAIQAALDAFKGIHIPQGNYKITAPLNLNDNNFIFGEGRGSILTSTHNGPVFQGKAVTPASGTNVRRFSGGGSNFMIYGPGVASTGSIGLDMRGCTMFKWFDVLIQNINTGVFQGGGYSTYYNEYYGVDISTVEFGYYSDSLGNENLVVGGRVNDCTTGTRDADNSHNKYIGLAIEVFTNGHLTTSPACSYITYISSRLENVPTTGTAFNISSDSQDTTIIAPAMIGVSTELSNSGLRLNMLASEWFAIASGTRIKGHFSQVVTQTIAPLAAGAVRQELFTVPNVAVGNSIFFTAPASWPAGLVAGPVINGGTNTVYVQLYNPTVSTITPSSANYIFDIWKH